MLMANTPPLVVLRDEPTAANPWRRIPHRVDQPLWIALFGRPRTPSSIPSPGQRPHDRPQQRQTR